MATEMPMAAAVHTRMLAMAVAKEVMKTDPCLAQGGVAMAMPTAAGVRVVLLGMASVVAVMEVESSKAATVAREAQEQTGPHGCHWICALPLHLLCRQTP